MKKLSKVALDTTTLPGHRLVRYTAVMVNVGAGPLELIGTRPDTSTTPVSDSTWSAGSSRNGAADRGMPLLAEGVVLGCLAS